MKVRVLLLVAPLLSLSGQLFASAPLDSIGVENLNGKKVVLHKLDPKDNYYSISRRYNVTPGSIILFNNNAPLKIGSVIKVPTEQPFLAPAVQPVVSQSVAVAPKNTSVVAQNAPVVSQTTSATVTAEADLQQYRVSAGETLYSIAKRFNTTVDDIVKLNNLPSSSAAAGQVLKIKLNSATPPPPVIPVAPPIIAERDAVVYSSAQDSMNAVKFGANKFGLFEKAEKGIAVSMTEEGLDPSKKLALHRTAPIGTVIKITNPMTGKTTFAKVVGRFTDSESTKDAIIVVTKNVSDSIGALDKRVHVNISYGSPNE